MDIKAQFCTFIGANFEQIMRCYLAKIESFDNITSEGIVYASGYTYEYFTLTDGEQTFRFCVRGQDSYNRMYVSIAGPSSSGGTGLLNFQLNSSLSLLYYDTSGTGLYYVNCWVFSSGNNFVGMSVLFAQTNAPQGWFLFLKNQEDELRLVPSRSYDSTQLYVHDSEYSDQTRRLIKLNSNLDSANARKQDLPDYVYIESATYKSTSTNEFGVLQGLYYLMNYMIYDLGTGNYQKSFQMIGTEDGSYLHLNQDIFVKIAEVLEKSVVKYEAA